MAPRHRCPESNRPCLNYDDHICAGPDLDGCVGPCARGERDTPKVVKQSTSKELPDVRARMVMRDQDNPSFITVELVRSDSQHIYRMRLYDDGSFTA